VLAGVFVVVLDRVGLSLVDPWIDVGGVSGWWFSVASCGRVEVGVADVKRMGEERINVSIDRSIALVVERRSRGHSSLSCSDIYLVSYMSEATAGMTTSALFCYSTV
jgi:hypothetical protein